MLLEQLERREVQLVLDRLLLPVFGEVFDGPHIARGRFGIDALLAQAAVVLAALEGGEAPLVSRRRV